MDRSRGGRPNRRKTLPTSSIQSDNSAGGESTSSIMTRSPPSAAASRTPQTAPPNRRATKPIPMSNPFASVRSSPSTAAPVPGSTPAKGSRRKSRTGAIDGAADDEDEAYRKGPHTLRKRTKIDYSAADFEDELPEIAIPAPRAATRKRRADSEVVDEEYFTPASNKRRATSRDFSVASLSAARRRTPARRSVVEAPQSFYSQPSDEDIVKDTIEVVGDSSDLVSSDGSSDHDDEEHDVSGHISLPDSHNHTHNHNHQQSSPTQRKAKEVHQLVSPVEQQQQQQQKPVTQDEPKPEPEQTQHVSAVVASPERMSPSPDIAQPQPIHPSTVTIINNTDQAAPEPQSTPTKHVEPAEEFTVQPKREQASSPVRPTDTAPTEAAQPEAAESATTTTGNQVGLGSLENSAPAPITNNSDTVSAPTAAVDGEEGNGHDHVAAPPTDEISAPVAEEQKVNGETVVAPSVNGEVVNGDIVNGETVNGETGNGNVDAVEEDLPAAEQSQQPPQSPEPAAETDNVKVSESFSAQAKEEPPFYEEMEVDGHGEPDVEMKEDAPIEDSEQIPEELPVEPAAEEPETKVKESEPKATESSPKSTESSPQSTESSPQSTERSPNAKRHEQRSRRHENKTKKPQYPWSRLTPYHRGRYVKHSLYSVWVQPSAKTSNAEGPDANGDAENNEDSAEQVNAAGEGQQDGDEDANADVDAEGDVDDAERDAEHEEEQPADGQGPSASQESTINSEVPTPALTPRQGSPVQPSAAPTGTTTPAPAAGPKWKYRQQFYFKKVRDPSEFMEFLKDTKDLSYEELWDLLEQANKALVAWQDEYKKCSKTVDDYENAVRRKAQDEAFEKKTADLDAFSKVESYIEKDFEVQGYRAGIKEKDAGVLEQRWQDRVMASSFGFEYDPHPNKVGNQDPDAQREGGGGGRQLRSQPQASAKAAEGDGVIVSGKRTRNPPKLFEGVLQDDRQATPGGNKPGPKRRGRAAAADKSFTSVPDEPEPEPEAQTVSPAKGGPRKRGRGKRAVIVESEQNTPAPEQEDVAPPPEPEQQAPPKRKRGRQPKVQPVEEPEPAPQQRTPKRGRAAKRQSNAAPAPETTDESRPTSSSSNATISDDGSTYGLRQNKRQRNWREEADEEEEEEEEIVETQPQPKRPRIRLNRKQSAPELATKKTSSERILTEIRDFLAPGTPDVPQLIVTFKLVGKDRWTVKGASRQTSTDASEYTASTPRPAPASAPASAKSSAPPSQAGEEKDYSTMTKSEKMSASMKKRWLNGSMQGAVNKRKATLAAKKAAAAAAEAKDATQGQAQPAPQQNNAVQFHQHTGILPMPSTHGHGRPQ
ncbi:hypothetical protein CPLU01_05407 [Colletotrichum plurivorum]|uniref:Uncharacterized protein n=1 Tax=Colletotrichum plurivorum TaxID=2175906 RepID=A0A8H6NIG9_9PEZI|nr:hypothetical protein CPLU01_05407 [Colletotrichum plurivorum]